MGRKGFTTKHKSIYTYGHFTELVQSQKRLKNILFIQIV